MDPWQINSRVAGGPQEPTTNSFIPTTLPVLLWLKSVLPGPLPTLGQQPLTPLFPVSDYHKSLEDALSSDTSGHFKRILISLATVGEFMAPPAWPSGALGWIRVATRGRGFTPDEKRMSSPAAS